MYYVVVNKPPQLKKTHMKNVGTRMCFRLVELANLSPYKLSLKVHIEKLLTDFLIKGFSKPNSTLVASWIA